MNNQAGKGDKPRPVDKKAFDANFEAIKWSNGRLTQGEARKNKTTYKY